MSQVAHGDRWGVANAIVGYHRDMSDVPPPLPETEPEIPPPHRPVPDVPLTEPRPNEPPTRILPGDPAPDTEPEPV
jgi:hypothetical protein